MATLRAAVIGCGRIGSTIDDEIDRWSSVGLPYSHAARYAAANETELVAGCDPDQARAEAFRQRWGLERAFTDIHQMMEATRPDIVSIATQTSVRIEAALACVEHRPRAIFADKPLAETLADADRLLCACRSEGIIVAVNCSRRWEPRSIHARDMLQEGLIGELRAVVAFCPGGLSHMGSHMIDFMRYYAGDVEWVVGQTSSPVEDQPERDIGGLGILQFSNGVHGYLNMLDPGPLGVELDLIGTQGRIRSINNDADWELWLPGAVPTKHKTLAKQQFPIPHDMTGFGVRSVQDICRCIETGDTPLCSGEDGRAALEIALALRQSGLESNRRVDLPFEDDRAAIRSA